jgi:hypothetical protein
VTEALPALAWNGAAPEPFQISNAQSVLDDLQQRLKRARWPERMPGEPWAYGTDVDYPKQLCGTSAPQPIIAIEIAGTSVMMSRTAKFTTTNGTWPKAFGSPHARRGRGLSSRLRAAMQAIPLFP